MDMNTFTQYFMQYGAIAIFVVVFLENLNLPGFPAGVIMPLSGAMAAKGDIGFWTVVTVTVAAGLSGSMVLYLIGRKAGELFLNAYLRRFPRHKAGLEKSMEWVKNKGAAGVFVAKLLPVVRTLISIPAGVLKMPVGEYAVSSALGIFIWNLIFVGTGYVLGNRF